MNLHSHLRLRLHLYFQWENTNDMFAPISYLHYKHSHSLLKDKDALEQPRNKQINKQLGKQAQRIASHRRRKEDKAWEANVNSCVMQIRKNLLKIILVTMSTVHGTDEKIIIMNFLCQS